MTPITPKRKLRGYASCPLQDPLLQVSYEEGKANNIQEGKGCAVSCHEQVGNLQSDYI